MLGEGMSAAGNLGYEEAGEDEDEERPAPV